MCLLRTFAVFINFYLAVPFPFLLVPFTHLLERQNNPKFQRSVPLNYGLLQPKIKWKFFAHYCNRLAKHKGCTNIVKQSVICIRNPYMTLDLP